MPFWSAADGVSGSQAQLQRLLRDMRLCWSAGVSPAAGTVAIEMCGKKSATGCKAGVLRRDSRAPFQRHATPRRINWPAQIPGMSHQAGKKCASQWKSQGQNLMTPCVAPHACHKQKAIKAMDWNNPVHRFWRRRFLKSTNAHGQRTNPTWQIKPQIKNLNLPDRLSQGIHD